MEFVRVDWFYWLALIIASVCPLCWGGIDVGLQRVPATAYYAQTKHVIPASATLLFQFPFSFSLRWMHIHLPAVDLTFSRIFSLLDFEAWSLKICSLIVCYHMRYLPTCRENKIRWNNKNTRSEIFTYEKGTYEIFIVRFDDYFKNILLRQKNILYDSAMSHHCVWQLNIIIKIIINLISYVVRLECVQPVERSARAHKYACSQCQLAGSQRLSSTVWIALTALVQYKETRRHLSAWTLGTV